MDRFEQSMMQIDTLINKMEEKRDYQRAEEKRIEGLEGYKLVFDQVAWPEGELGKIFQACIEGDDYCDIGSLVMVIYERHREMQK